MFKATTTTTTLASQKRRHTVGEKLCAETSSKHVPHTHVPHAFHFSLSNHKPFGIGKVTLLAKYTYIVQSSIAHYLGLPLDTYPFKYIYIYKYIYVYILVLTEQLYFRKLVPRINCHSLHLPKHNNNNNKNTSF